MAMYDGEIVELYGMCTRPVPRKGEDMCKDLVYKNGNGDLVIETQDPSDAIQHVAYSRNEAEELLAIIQQYLKETK